jgi:hypothetical protein
MAFWRTLRTVRRSSFERTPAGVRDHYADDLDRLAVSVVALAYYSCGEPRGQRASRSQTHGRSRADPLVAPCGSPASSPSDRRWFRAETIPRRHHHPWRLVRHVRWVLRATLAASTVRATLKRFRTAGLSWPLPEEMTDAVLDPTGKRRLATAHAMSSHLSPPPEPDRRLGSSSVSALPAARRFRRKRS